MVLTGGMHPMPWRGLYIIFTSSLIKLAAGLTLPYTSIFPDAAVFRAKKTSCSQQERAGRPEDWPWTGSTNLVDLISPRCPRYSGTRPDTSAIRPPRTGPHSHDGGDRGGPIDNDYVIRL